MRAWEWAGHRRGREKELVVSASLRCHRQEIDKFPAPPKKARVSYPLAAFATRKPVLACVPLVSENEGSRISVNSARSRSYVGGYGRTWANRTRAGRVCENRQCR